MILLIILFLTSKITAMASAQGQVVLNQQKVVSEWKCVDKKQEWALFERWILVNNQMRLRERKGEIIVHCDYYLAINYLSEIERLRDWMHSVVSVQKLHSSSEGESLRHIVFRLPFPFNNRDVVASVQTSVVDNTQSYIQINSKSNATEYPKMKRINAFTAKWNIQKLEDGKVKISFVTFSTEPPLFPDWIQNPVIEREFKKNLLRLKGELSKEEYASAS